MKNAKKQRSHICESVATAACMSMETAKIGLSPHETPLNDLQKIDMHDYVMDSTPHANICSN